MMSVKSLINFRASFLTLAVLVLGTFSQSDAVK